MTPTAMKPVKSILTNGSTSLVTSGELLTNGSTSLVTSGDLLTNANVSLVTSDDSLTNGNVSLALNDEILTNEDNQVQNNDIIENCEPKTASDVTTDLNSVLDADFTKMQLKARLINRRSSADLVIAEYVKVGYPCPCFILNFAS